MVITLKKWKKYLMNHNNHYNDRVLEWIVANNLKNSKGDPFEWRDHEFLIDPLCDWHPYQGMNKGTQLGVSETWVLKTLYASKEQGYNVIYTLPTDAFLSKFVPPKVDQILANNKIFGKIKGGVQLKSVPYRSKERFIYYMGAYTSKSAGNKEESDKGISVSADILINDEASRSDQFVLSQLETRLDNSDYGAIWKFDNPSLPSQGSDAIYKRSDQRHWFITCPRCRYKQYLSWDRLDENDFESGTSHTWVDTDSKVFRCGNCKKALSDEDRRAGEWVAKFSDITDYRGYWMPQMIYKKHSVSKLLRKANDNTKPISQFYNYVLAKPYLGSETGISRENIISNLTKGYYNYNGMALGVDQGKIKTWVLGSEQGIIRVGQTESWDEIENLIKKYKPITVIDNLPYTYHPTLLAKKYPHLVYRAIFKNESDVSEVAQFFSNKEDPNKVLIKREQMFEIIVSSILAGQSPIFTDIGELEDFIVEWSRLVRVIKEDRRGNERSIWEKSEEPCDFPFAHLYYKVALMRGKRGAKMSGATIQGVELPKPIDMGGGSIEADFMKEYFELPSDSSNIV